MEPRILLGISTALIYAFVAVAANFSTKFATQLLPGVPDVVLLAQLAVMLGAARVAQVLGFVDLPAMSMKRLWAMAPLSLAYGLHAALVLRALTALNVPMYNTLKRTTPLIVLIAKWVISKQPPNPQVAASVAVIVAGCVVAGKGDLAFSTYGYGLALACAGLQAAYILLTEYLPPTSTLEPPPPALDASHGITMLPLVPLIQRSHDSEAALESLAGPGPGAGRDGHAPRSIVQGGDLLVERGGAGGGREGGADAHAHVHVLGEGKRHAPGGGTAAMWVQLRQALTSTAEAMQYVPATCMPLLLAWALLTRQVHGLNAALWGPGMQGRLLHLWLAIIACMEFLLMATLTLCTQTNSALTTTVVGVLKGTLAVVLGFVLLGGMGPLGYTRLGVFGIGLNCLGGAWYAYAKYVESLKSKQPQLSSSNKDSDSQD